MWCGGTGNPTARFGAVSRPFAHFHAPVRRCAAASPGTDTSIPRALSVADTAVRLCPRQRPNLPHHAALTRPQTMLAIVLAVVLCLAAAVPVEDRPATAPPMERSKLMDFALSLDVDDDHPIEGMLADAKRLGVAPPNSPLMSLLLDSLPDNPAAQELAQLMDRAAPAPAPAQPARQLDGLTEAAVVQAMQDEIQLALSQAADSGMAVPSADQLVLALRAELEAHHESAAASATSAPLSSSAALLATSVAGLDRSSTDVMLTWTSVAESVDVWEIDALQRARFPFLRLVRGHICVYNNIRLTAFAMPLLREVQSTVDFYANTALTLLDLSQLALVAGDLTLSVNDNLQRLDLGSLQSTAGFLHVTYSFRLQHIDLRALCMVGGDLIVAELPVLTAVDLSALAMVKGKLFIAGNGQLGALSLPLLLLVGASLDLSHNEALQTVELPQLVFARTASFCGSGAAVFSAPIALAMQDCARLAEDDLPLPALV